MLGDEGEHRINVKDLGGYTGIDYAYELRCLHPRPS
jgi:hypothetical protein